MARIELRDCSILFKDGFGGTAAVDDMSISNGQTNIDIDTVADLTNNSTIVPVGAHFSIAGVANPSDFTVTGQNANQQYLLTITAATGGNYDLVVDGQAVDDISYDAINTAIASAINGVIGANSVSVSGTNPFTIEFIGTDYVGEAVTATLDDSDLTGSGGEAGTLDELHSGGTTWRLTFTPPLVNADLPSNDDVITFAPQQIEIKVGDGDLTYTEKNEYTYELDRGELDTVREGDDQPLEVSIDMVYEHITTGTNESVSPMDALKGIGGASGWVSASPDQCEPYAIDVEVIQTAPCGTSEDETTLFPDFRSESREISLRDATIKVTGKCNAVVPNVARA